MKPANDKPTRREFLRSLGRNAMFAVIALFCGWLIGRKRCGAGEAGICGTCKQISFCSLPQAIKTRNVAARKTVWQIDPEKCVQCGKCATHCVLNPSAVKCVHQFKLCGYCKLCFGFFQPGANALSSAAENQLCPAGAIKRTFVEDPYYEYTIDESLCIGCGKCVKGCGSFGNGSLHLQVKHDICLDCNECEIARNCPTDAFKRVPANEPYLIKEVKA